MEERSNARHVTGEGYPGYLMNSEVTIMWRMIYKVVKQRR